MSGAAEVDPWSVACPTCGVGPHEHCRMLRRHTFSRITSPHLARRRAAQAETPADPEKGQPGHSTL